MSSTQKFKCSDGVLVDLGKDMVESSTFLSTLASTKGSDQTTVPVSSENMRRLVVIVGGGPVDESLSLKALLELAVDADFLGLESVVMKCCGIAKEVLLQQGIFYMFPHQDPPAHLVKERLESMKRVLNKGLKQAGAHSMRAYEGTDCNITYQRRCGLCEPDSQQSDLSQCARCRCVYYCGREHQVADFRSHKDVCKRIGALQSLVEQQEREAKDSGQWDQMMGSLWGLANLGREYMSNRLNLAMTIEEVAHHHPEPAEAWEKSLNHLLELLRLNISDNQGVRWLVVYRFLQLNRDDACANFIRHWQRWADGDDDDAVIWEEGAWPYGEGATRYDDLWSNEESVMYESLPFLMAGIIMKARLAGLHRTRKDILEDLLKVCESFPQGSPLERLSRTAVAESLKLELLGNADHVRRMEEQEKLLHKYIAFTRVRNPHVLPLLGDVAKLRSLPDPEVYSNGSMEEAVFTLQNGCVRLCYRAPFIESVVKKMAKGE